MENKHQYSSCTISTHHCRCFEKLTPEELELMDANSVLIKYGKKEIICKQGGFVSHIMFMEQGLAKVYLDNGPNSLVLKIIPGGNLLGLSSISEEQNTFHYSAMTYIESEIRQIDINIFRHLLKQNPDFAKEVIEILSANTLQIYGRFFCLTHKQSFGRLADILLCLSDRIFKQSEFELPLSRKELAELSGMSSETAIRLLKKFIDDELISMDGRTIKVLDYNRLQRISKTG